MSPRRKSGLSPEDLQALKHLPAVLRALENLQEQHAKVRALMGGGMMITVPPPSPEMTARMEAVRREMREAGMPVANPTLDTPERREYEEAKRNGRKVPVADPFANASPAQRERMAEQRAMIEAERAARGLPRQTIKTITGKLQMVREMAESNLVPPEAVEEVVRTETLDTVSDGTTPLAGGADDEPEVH